MWAWPVGVGVGSGRKTKGVMSCLFHLGQPDQKWAERYKKDIGVFAENQNTLYRR